MGNSNGASLKPADTLLQQLVPCDGQGNQGITHVDSELKDTQSGGVTVVAANNLTLNIESSFVGTNC